MIRAYVLDLNGIFLKSEYLSVRMEKEFGVSAQIVLPILNEVMDKVRVPNAPSLFSLLSPHLVKWGIKSTESEFLNWWFAGESLQKSLLEFCKKKREEGDMVFILSNNFRERTQYYREKFPEIFQNVDKAYFSWETGHVKPDIACYRNILNEHNLNPNEVIYVDDSKKNIEAASSLGIKCFERFEDIKLIVNI